MSFFELEQNEKILATDLVLQYSNPILAHNADCTLTSSRLVLEPKGAIDRLSGNNVIVLLSSITTIKKEDGLHCISHSNGTIKISGSGADRICERLQMLLSHDKQVLQETVLLQGDTLVYVMGPIGTKGEIILTNASLTIRTTSGLENLVFSPKVFKTSLLDIQHLKFSNLEQKLTIHTKEEEIAISGKNAVKLHSTLRSLEGSNLEDLEKIDATTMKTTFDAMLYRGASKPSITGEISFTPEKMMFAPQNALDTLTGAELKMIFLSNIQKISKKNNLEITTLDQKLQFMTSYIEDVFNTLQDKLVGIDRSALFTDIRSKDYSEIKALQEVKSLKLPFNIEDDIPVLCDQCVIYKDSGQTSYFGYLFMTEQKTRLISLNYQTLWEATNFNISIVENRKPQDPLLQLLHKEQRVVILPKSGKNIHEYFHRKIKESRPSEAEQFSKDNQPVQRVLGQCVLVQFTYENVVLHTIYSTTLSIQTRGIQINGEKCIHFTCPMGAKVQIEVPKKEGRYRFSSIITEQYLQTPDPVGKYYITLAVPSNISLFNDRAAYRAPMPMPLEMSVLVLPPYDTEREKPQEFFNLAKEQHTIMANMHDISISGMGFFLPSSIKAYQVPMHRLVMRCSLDLHGEKIILQGIPKYELSLQDQKRDNKLNNYRVGMEFVNINNFERSLINRTVLKIEREQIRKEQEKKQEST